MLVVQRERLGVPSLLSVLLVLGAVMPSPPRVEATRYEPNWESLDSRPLPAWYDEAKIGIFIHWGVFSVPGYNGPWIWYWWKSGLPSVVDYMKAHYPPDFTYADWAAQFTAIFFEPQYWADVFNASGARYVVQVTKHHEGFCSWPSKFSWNWNAGDVGPRRDLVGELAEAIRNRTRLRYGVYHSLFEFYNPLWLQDKANHLTTRRFATEKTLPELYELVERYKPEVVWSDGDWEAPDSYWNSTGFLAWLYNDSPVKDTVVTNDRWGSNVVCKHGGFLTCHDNFNPGTLQRRKFEDATTLDGKNWGYRRYAHSPDFLSMETVTERIARVVSCGGNVLFNVAPTADGTLLPIYEERLRQMGQWLGVNGEAIYGSRPWTFQNDTLAQGVWYTSKTEDSSGGAAVYAILLDWPEDRTLHLAAPEPSRDTVVTMLGVRGAFYWTVHPEGGMVISVPDIPIHRLPCLWAWVLKLTALTN